ncbi:MAG: CrcB family protein [Pseudomonadota bacterium]
MAAGGALGSVLRYLSVSVFARIAGDVAIGTFFVNVVGSFLMGCVFALLLERPEGSLSRFVPLISVGLLGGFTTFSAFSLDVLRLFESGRLWFAGLYATGSVAISIVAVFLGVAFIRAQSA